MQIELPGTPINELLKMPVSVFDELIKSKQWEDHIKNDPRQKQFEILIKSIADAGNAICKTISSGLDALIRSMVRK